MGLKDSLEFAKNLLVIKECLIDYTGPLFIFGEITSLLNKKNVTIVSATMNREEFAIINNSIPNWVNEVRLKATDSTNILLIEDMDKISIDRQEIFLDIIKNNKISSEDLPDNLKIIINSEKKCAINSKIRDIVECYEI